MRKYQGLVIPKDSKKTIAKFQAMVKEYLHLNWTVTINKRLSRTNAQVLLNQQKIELAIKFFYFDPRDQLDVFLHELAHCYQYEMDGYTGHDARFRSICEMFGTPRSSANGIRQYKDRELEYK